MHVSLHALSGSLGYRIMRFSGMYNNRRLYVLIDSGSTHNFLSEQTAHKLGCSLRAVSEVQVIVANGQELQCKGFCEG